jgi:hypothetical protein
VPVSLQIVPEILKLAGVCGWRFLPHRDESLPQQRGGRRSVLGAICSIIRLQPAARYGGGFVARQSSGFSGA